MLRGIVVRADHPDPQAGDADLAGLSDIPAVVLRDELRDGVRTVRLRYGAHFGWVERLEERDVPLPQSIAFLLAAALESCPGRQVTLPWKHPAGDHMTVRLIFTNEAGTAIHRSTFDERVWKPALAAAGVIPERRRGQAKYQAAPADGLHALRHYYASALLADGVEIRTLSEYLGHADPGFTLKVYCHLMHQARTVPAPPSTRCSAPSRREVPAMCPRPTDERRQRRSGGRICG